jgi:hypothetical protein
LALERETRPAHRCGTKKPADLATGGLFYMVGAARIELATPAV